MVVLFAAILVLAIIGLAYIGLTLVLPIVPLLIVMLGYLIVGGTVAYACYYALGVTLDLFRLAGGASINQCTYIKPMVRNKRD